MVTPAYDSGVPGSSASPSTPSSGPSSPASSHAPAPAPARRPTITDVARAAGVSIAVVSYALNGRPGVSAATRERVLRVADEFGWRPSAAARSMRTGPRAIGLVFDRGAAGPVAQATGVLEFIISLQEVLATRNLRSGAPARRRTGGRRRPVRRVVGRAPVRRHGRHGRARGGSADRRAATSARPRRDRQCRSERCGPRLGDASTMPRRSSASVATCSSWGIGTWLWSAVRRSSCGPGNASRPSRACSTRRAACWSTRPPAAPPRRPRWRPDGC